MGKKFIFSLIVLYLSFFGVSQTPSEDDNWTLNTSKSDEFDTFNSTRWEDNVTGGYQGYLPNWGGNSYFISSNVTINNGVLELETDAPSNGSTPPYTFSECCTTGGIESKTEEYGYGYYEIYAKLPGNYEDGVPNAQKFQPAFWLHNFEYGNGNECTAGYAKDEIDILELDFTPSSEGRVVTSGFWDIDQSNCAKKYSHCEFESSTPLFEDYHKYACEYLPDRINFYFDDKLYGTYYSKNDSKIPSELMRMVITSQINISVDEFNQDITFPQILYVDYFRYYEMEYDCATDETVSSYTDITNFDFAVKKTITFDNQGGGYTNLQIGDHKTFRATDEIVIENGFTVPLGASINLMQADCE